MGRPDYPKAEKHAFLELELLSENSETLYFHNIDYTKDILKAIARLVVPSENISQIELLLLKTAALFQNMGYVTKYQNPEKEAVKTVRRVLPPYGYNQDHRDRISNMIMATEIPQKPKTKSQKILCDAGSDYLRRVDFLAKTELLRLERVKHGAKINPREWHEQRLKILEEHEYFIQFARKSRDKGKEKNIRELKELLGLND